MSKSHKHHPHHHKEIITNQAGKSESKLESETKPVDRVVSKEAIDALFASILEKSNANRSADSSQEGGLLMSQAHPEQKPG